MKKYVLLIFIFIVLVVSTIHVSASDWNMYNGQEIIILPMDGINIPVQVSEPEVVLRNKEFGKFAFSNGKMRSITKTSIVGEPTNAEPSYNFRPTLFVSLHGYRVSRGVDPWQKEFHTKLSTIIQEDNPRASQYKHIMIRWDSTKINTRQIKDAVEEISDFLNDRAYPWDVVVIGHSRGGIFAHELSEKLVSKGNIANLHTILLDPTATIGAYGALNDQYPLGLKSKGSGGTHYGSLYYDKQSFFIAADITTVGDQLINGYNNYGRGIEDHYFVYDVPVVSHTEFGNNWVKSSSKGLERSLTDIWSRKTTDTFSLDPAVDLLQVYDIREDDVIIDGSFRIVDGNVRFDGMIIVGDGTYGAGASINGEIGKSGVDIATTVLVVSAQAVINSSYAGASANLYLANASAAMSEKGINTSASVLGASQSWNLSFDGGINTSYGTSAFGASIEYEIGTSGIEIRIGGTTVFSAEQTADSAASVTNAIAVESWNVTEGLIVSSANVAVGLVEEGGGVLENAVNTLVEAGNNVDLNPLDGDVDLDPFD